VVEATILILLLLLLLLHTHYDISDMIGRSDHGLFLIMWVCWLRIIRLRSVPTGASWRVCTVKEESIALINVRFSAEAKLQSVARRHSLVLLYNYERTIDCDGDGGHKCAGKGITAKNKKNQTKQILNALLKVSPIKTRWYRLDGRVLAWAKMGTDTDDDGEPAGSAISMAEVSGWNEVA